MYPADFITVAMPVMLRASAEKPPMGLSGLWFVGSIFITFAWIGFLPLWSEHRVGEQYLKTYAWSSSTPDATKLSMKGVAAVASLFCDGVDG